MGDNEMKNKPNNCPYCNEYLVLKLDYCYEVIEIDKPNFDLKNMRKRFFYICKNCQFTVGEIKQDKVEWISKEEALKRKKCMGDNKMNKYHNKITCGDSYKLIKELPDKSVDLIVTDPP